MRVRGAPPDSFLSIPGRADRLSPTSKRVAELVAQMLTLPKQLARSRRAQISISAAAHSVRFKSAASMLKAAPAFEDQLRTRARSFKRNMVAADFGAPKRVGTDGWAAVHPITASDARRL